MSQLNTRERILPNTPQYAEPVDRNFAEIWRVVNGNIAADNVLNNSITGGTNGEIALDTVTTENIKYNTIMRNDLNDADCNDQLATIASLRTLGTGAEQAAAGNHNHTNHLVPMVVVNDTSITTTTQGYKGSQGSTRTCSHTISGRKGYHRYVAIEFNMYVQTNGNAGGAALNKTYNDQSNQLGTVTYSSTGAGLKKILLDLDSVPLHSGWTVYLQIWNTDGSTSTYSRPQNIYWVNDATTIVPDATAVY